MSAGCGGHFAAHGSAEFQPGDFDYLITDECHRATAETQQCVLSWFRGVRLLATPERADGEGLKTFRAAISENWPL